MWVIIIGTEPDPACKPDLGFVVIAIGNGHWKRLGNVNIVGHIAIKRSQFGANENKSHLGQRGILMIPMVSI
ncbi:MAG: hypothetical protein GPOALKHO_000542 [Sodalis sp.]|nr:MAG: hypothetical protein GPOALKHO_000542 [Sodalis sp.]